MCVEIGGRRERKFKGRNKGGDERRHGRYQSKCKNRRKGIAV
jgi:hypothetical protein